MRQAKWNGQSLPMAVYPNWFEIEAIHFFDRNLKHLGGNPGLQFLQIGTYTGDASVWLKDNILTHSTSYLTDVDTWEGSDESIHKQFNWQSIEEVYDNKLFDYKNVIKYKGTSFSFLESAKKDHYDFIYIDGDHTEAGTYSDAVMAWPCLKSGGIMAFDDYHWQHESGREELRPAPAIDKFIEQNKDNLTVIEIGYQYWIKKS